MNVKFIIPLNMPELVHDDSLCKIKVSIVQQYVLGVWKVSAVSCTS